MNDSKLVHDINKTLYALEHESHSILKSRTFTVANNTRLAIRRPLSFAGKAAKFIATDPKRLVNTVLGKRIINGTPEAIQHDIDLYNQWIDKTKQTIGDLKKQREKAEKFKYKPLISLITPVFNAPTEAHNELIQSVIDQTYGNFELFLYNFSNNNDRKLVKLLDDWTAKDSRIKVRHNLKNGHISENSNLCLEDVTGEYVGLLDHDDALTQNALYECVKAINDDPKTDFIYTDKDKISEDEIRFEGFFKPDWSPEMALGGNYLTHFNIMRTSIVREVGGWDPKTDGAQDWDLFLKIADKSPHIKHVPEITYHWRIVAGSTAGGMAAKPYAIKAQQLAVQKHLKRKDIKATAYHDSLGQSYIDWPKHDTGKPLGIFVHVAYDDIENIESIFELLKNEPYEVYLLIEEISSSLMEENKLDLPYQHKVITYVRGSLTSRVKEVIKKENLGEVVFIKDSVSSIEYREERSWIDQLTGWLSIEGVAVAGPAVFSANGQVIDVGSIYDSSTRNFGRLYFGTGHQSGYSGYIQWIRNFSKTTEQIYAFKTAILNKVPDNIRDDELATAISIAALSGGQRTVYDPSVQVRDLSRHYLIMPNSVAIEDQLKDCQVLSGGDPYFNRNLNFEVHNPQPTMGNNRGAIENSVHKLHKHI